MRAFLMHVGHPGHVDLDWTVKRRRTLDEMLRKLPADSPEADYFRDDADLAAAFPDRSFSCWGVPPKAESQFRRTRVGDLVLFVPWIGIHEGGVHQIGVIKAICPIRCSASSTILWPKTPHQRPYPWLFFFDTEIGHRDWGDFLEDMGYAENWDPRGWYRRIADPHFTRWNGVPGYLDFLRKQAGFKPPSP